MSNKPLRVAFQMDAMDDVNIAGDSTFAMIIEAQTRGYEIYHYLPNDLIYDEGTVRAFAHPMTVRYEEGNHYTFGEGRMMDLAEDIDVIQMRQDPPFDMAYITATHLLDLIHPKTLVVNNPTEVRNAPEKLFVTHEKFRALMPPTMITRRLEDIQAFREKHGEIIIKPLFGMGGSGVFHLKEGDSNLMALTELFFETSREALMIQKFLPQVVHGDKRIILIDGKASGGVNRVPAKGEIRSNLVAGGIAVETDLTEKEQEICDILGPELKSRGLLFVGIDVIDGWLTEINVTSPTGIMAINKFKNVNLAGDLWDAIEAKV